MICFVILAHANEDVLKNQVENIRIFNPGSKVVLYNGGDDPNFGKSVNVDICPYSRPLKYGRLERCLIDVMRWLEETNSDYDYIVNLDSDILFVRPGFEDYIETLMNGYDCMGIALRVHSAPSDDPNCVQAQTMWKEWRQWQPFFGTNYFCVVINGMQLYRRQIVRKMIQDIDWIKLEQLLEDTAVFALEEMLHVTLAVRSGAKYTVYPEETSRYIFAGLWTVEEAVQDPHAYFVHPIPRVLDDPLRCWITNHITSS